ncbi:MAG: hypothetical protein EXR49_08440 [Dehalococcoidia bacterium]|nr:hypothetical protein [Dehalococcoidia bacterium]
MGKPAVLISTERFTDACKSMARVGGIPDLRWAIVQHPLGSATDAELRERAASAVEQFVEIVTAG